MASMVQHSHLHTGVCYEQDGHDEGPAHLPEHELLLQAVVKDDLQECVLTYLLVASLDHLWRPHCGEGKGNRLHALIICRVPDVPDSQSSSSDFFLTKMIARFEFYSSTILILFL